MPAKANPQKQREFFETVLRPLMKQAKDGKITLLFTDAAHFVMGCDFLGYIYGKFRRFVKTFSGRVRYNVLGALDFCSNRVVTVTNDTYITALQVCELLAKIAADYTGRAIYVVLDNAKYQKCAAVIEKAAELGIRLVFIPPYSPNLNLVERLWRFVKARLRTRFYNDFGRFCATIDGLVASTVSANKTIVEKLISEKVQLFDDLVAVNENTFQMGSQSRII